MKCERNSQSEEELDAIMWFEEYGCFVVGVLCLSLALVYAMAVG